MNNINKILDNLEFGGAMGAGAVNPIDAAFGPGSTDPAAGAGGAAADDPKKEFNYYKMLEGIAAGSGYMSEASQDAQQPAGGTTTRGSLPAQPMTNLYGNMGGGSPAMQAIQNSKSMIGAQPSIEQILQSLAR